MAVRTRDYPPPQTNINWRKLFAAVAQLASWFTTLWAVQWIWNDGTFAGQVLVAILVEVLLIICKTQLFTGDDVAVGWVGIAIDGLINAGGILPKSCKVISFPPVAALVTGLGGSAATCTTYEIPTVVLALVVGFGLSALPHRLWQTAMEE